MSLPELHLHVMPYGQFLSFKTDLGVGQDLTATGGKHVTELMKLAVEIHARRRSGILVDIGAHFGTFCVPVAKTTGCRVHAFEAQRIMSQLLSANVLINGIENAVVENVVLAAPGHPRGIDIPVIDYATPGNFGGFTVDPQLFERHAHKKMRRSGALETIRAATLDEFDLGDIFLIKLDVEGSELDVLRGATKTLARNSYPPLLFEAWDRDWWRDERQRLFDFIESLGYVIKSMGEDHLAEHPDHAKA